MLWHKYVFTFPVLPLVNNYTQLSLAH